MTNKDQLRKKMKAYDKTKQSLDFYERYGTEKEEGKAIERFQKLREKVIDLQDKKEKYGKGREIRK